MSLQKIQSIYSDMSNAEREVAEFVTHLGLWWTFEQPLFVYDDKDRPRVWSPDFYISSLGIYIEVVGNEKLGNYDYRKEIYNKNDLPVIFVYIQDFNWRDLLVNEIYRIHQLRWEKIRKL